MREKMLIYESHISAIYGPIELRFGYDFVKGHFFDILSVHAPINRFNYMMDL